MKPVKIACLSGKGGAGKTFLAVSLAAAAGTCTYIDCDVEEPNGRLFWGAAPLETIPVNKPLPSFDAEKCSNCRKCVDFCRFHALAFLKGTPKLFDEVCHGCGGCMLVCPEGAISETGKRVGTVELSRHGDVSIVTGVLDPGEASGIPVIHKALTYASGTTVLDCPPGSACAVMECVKAADLCLLAAEPTAFGLHNIRMVWELCALLRKPCAVVVNKETVPYGPLEAFCREQRLPVLARIPYDQGLAARLARGELAVETIPEVRARFEALWDEIGGLL